MLVSRRSGSRTGTSSTPSCRPGQLAARLPRLVVPWRAEAYNPVSTSDTLLTLVLTFRQEIVNLLKQLEEKVVATQALLSVRSISLSFSFSSSSASNQALPRHTDVLDWSTGNEDWRCRGLLQGPHLARGCEARDFDCQEMEERDWADDQVDEGEGGGGQAW